MPQIIPITPGVPWQEITTQIDDPDGSTNAHIFEVRWNVRDQAWFLHVYDQQRNPLAMGLKLVLGVYIGRRFQNIRLFRHGVLVMWDSSNKQVDATLDDISSRVFLMWISDLEILDGRGLLPEG